MKVVLNSLSITFPISGVGRYTLMLAKSLSIFIGEENIFWFGKVNENTENKNSRHLSIMHTSQSLFKKLFRKIPYCRSFIFNIRNNRFRSYVEKVKPHIYHETNYALFDFDEGQTVTTLYDLSFVRHPEWHPKDRVKYFEQYCLKKLTQVNKIITISEFTKKEIMELLGIQSNKIHVVPPGVDKVFKPEGKKLDNFPKDYILYVGNIEPRKNLSLLLEAYQFLPKKVKDKHPLVLAGAFGWYAKKLKEKLNYLKGKENLIVIGYISQNLLPNLYRGATLFVYPSLYEGFGLPVVEAMACGTPVIALNVTALPEVIGDAGLLVEPGNIDGLIDSILRILGNKETRDKMIKKGLHRAQEFSWWKCAQQMLEIYGQCFSKK